MDDSIGSSNLSVRGCLLLIRKGSVTQMHGYAVYLKEWFPFTRNLPPENFEDSY